MASFASPAELAEYTAGLIGPDDPRSQVILDGATKALQNYAGWHIAPAESVTLILDGGSSVLYLPTLKLNSVTSITVDGALQDVTSYEWSRVTGNVRVKNHGYFPDSWGGITVVFNSGHATVPADLKQIVLQVSAQALSSPTGATREQAGQVSMQWATTAPGVAGGLSLLGRDLAIIGHYRIEREV